MGATGDGEDGVTGPAATGPVSASGGRQPPPSSQGPPATPPPSSALPRHPLPDDLWLPPDAPAATRRPPPIVSASSRWDRPAHSGARFLDRPGAPPASRADAWFWLVMGCAGFLIGQVVGTVFVAIAAFASGEGGELSRFATMAAPPEWYVGTSLVGLWIGFFMGPWIASRVRGTGRFLADLGVRFRPVDLVGIPIGVGAQFLLDVLYAPFITHMKDFTAPTTKLVGASHGWGYLAIAILTVCGAPFFEEILFRGLAFKALARLFAPGEPGASRRRAVGLIAAVVVDGVLFGLAHWEPYQFAGLAVFGMLLALISYKTGRLGMNMVSHASFNLVAVLALVGTSGGVLH
ncbi:MAG: lysostaphin resistance A-like protein [Acidimicrobiales bacterium]